MKLFSISSSLLIIILSHFTISAQNKSADSSKAHKEITDYTISYNRKKIADEIKFDPLTAIQGTDPSSLISYDIDNSNIAIFPANYYLIGSSLPLYIVDGVQVQNLYFLNPSDIESVEIIKEGSTLALYGSRAINGIVRIQTRKAEIGDSGKVAFQFNNFVTNAGSHTHVFSLTKSLKRSSIASGVSYCGNIDDEYSIDKLSLYINSEHELIKRNGRKVIGIGENLTFGFRTKYPYLELTNIFSEYIISSSNQVSKNTLQGNAYITVSPFEGLIYTSTFQFNYSFTNTEIYAENSYRSLLANGTNSNEYVLLNSMEYTKELFPGHRLSCMAGHEFYTYYNSLFNWDSNDHFYTEGWHYVKPTYNAYAKNISVAQELYSRNMHSVFGSLSYTIYDRYILDAVVRTEKPNIVTDELRIFPAISGAWVLSNEPFMKHMKSIYAKLYAGWRHSDNKMWVSEQEYSHFNTGTEVHLVDHSLQASVNFHYTAPCIKPEGERTGLLYEGVTRTSSEVELKLTWKHNSEMFSYNTTGYVALKNNVYSIADEYYNSENTLRNRTYSDYYLGKKISEIFQSWDEVHSYKEELNTNAETYAQENNADTIYDNDYYRIIAPGDYRYQDVNKDGVVDNRDNALIGSTQPKYVLGYIFNCDYKNVYAHVSLYGAFGQDCYNAGYALESIYNSNNTSNMIEAFVTDNSFLKLKNLTVGYTFGSENSMFPKLQIYASLLNALTIRKYVGHDPEMGSNTMSNPSDLNSGFLLGISGEF